MEILGVPKMKIKLKGSELIAILFPQEYGKSREVNKETVLRKYHIDEKKVNAIKRALRMGRWKIL